MRLYHTLGLMLTLSIVLVACDSQDVQRDGTPALGDNAAVGAKATCPCWADTEELLTSLESATGCDGATDVEIVTRRLGGGYFHAAMICLPIDNDMAHVEYADVDPTCSSPGIGMDLNSKSEAQACAGIMRTASRLWTPTSPPPGQVSAAQ